MVKLCNVCHVAGIQKLVLEGRMGEAIEKTQQLYPGLLDRNRNLLFMLKCRQFIEMVNGTDSEVCGPSMLSPRSQSSSARSSPSMSPTHHGIVRQQGGGSGGSSPARAVTVTVPIAPSKSHSSHSVPSSSSSSSSSSTPLSSNTNNSATGLQSISEEEMNAQNNAMNGNAAPPTRIEEVDVDMDTSENDERTTSVVNGSAADFLNGTAENGNTGAEEEDDDMGKGGHPGTGSV